MKSIRIVPESGRRTNEDAGNAPFARKLEAEAEQVLAGRRSSGDSIEATIEREIALTFEHIQLERSLHRGERQSLLRIECYLDTEIMQRSPRPPFYYDTRLDERDRLRDRLNALEHERRRLVAEYLSRMIGLQNRLLHLLNRHRQIRLDDPNGHGSQRSERER
jgi:hypothetical protein